MANVRQLLVGEGELIDRLSLVTGHGKDVVRDILLAQAEFVIDELKNGIPVRLGKLGEFEVRECRCRGGYNFRTKKMGNPKIVSKVKFRPSVRMKRAIETITEIV